MEYRELLLEIGCEEMPASWIPGIEAQLADRLAAQLDAARIERRTPVRAFVAPRRLVATVAELADRQSDLEETVTGPPVRAAFDANGEPTRAALGFARKQGVDVADLARVQTPKGEYLACHRRQDGEDTRSLLGGVLAATLRGLAFPKAMRWDATLGDGRGEFLFGRPVRWLVFLYAARVVPFEIGRTPGAEAAGVAPVRGRQRHLRAPVLRWRRHAGSADRGDVVRRLPRPSRESMRADRSGRPQRSRHSRVGGPRQ